MKIITKDFPELPSKKRVTYINSAVLSDQAKDEIMRKRNRDNAALTRKRQRIYANFLDKTIEDLTQLLDGVAGAVPIQQGMEPPTAAPMVPVPLEADKGTKASKKKK